MKKLKATAALVGSLAMVGMAAAPTFAASGPPYDVWVDGQNTTDTAFSAEAGAIQFTVPLVTMGCNSVDADGTVLAGDTSGNPGGNTHIADIASTTWNSCTGPLGLPMTVTQNGTWEVHGTSPVTDGQTDVIDGYVGNVSATISQTGNPGACTFTAVGQAAGHFDEVDQELVVNQPRNADLQITSVTGCYGLVRVGDQATFTGTFKVGESGNPAADLPINVQEL